MEGHFPITIKGHIKQATLSLSCYLVETQSTSIQSVIRISLLKKIKNITNEVSTKTGDSSVITAKHFSNAYHRRNVKHQ